MSELLSLVSEFGDLQYSRTKLTIEDNQANCIGFCRMLLSKMDPTNRLFAIEDQNGRNITARVCEISLRDGKITMVGISHMGVYTTDRFLEPVVSGLIQQPGFHCAYDDLDQRVVTQEQRGNQLLIGRLLEPELYFTELIGRLDAKAPWMSAISTARNFGLE